MENPLRELEALGQSVWLDYIERDLIASGKLRRLIRNDGITGLTSNPAIFEKALCGGGAYDAAIRARADIGLDAHALYEALAVEDVQAAADVLATVYAATRGGDGYVSLEVSPHFAYDADATVREARRLWRAFDRPNAMIKVPATLPGVSAIRALIAEGINVNATLLFGLGRYADVAEAFLGGLEARAATGALVENVASVASFFLSRIDTLVDSRLRAVGTEAAHALRGRAAIAAARLAYQHYKRWTAAERWQRLAALGARPQRLLWASTSVKDPAYSDVQYVNALIGPETVTTVPPETLDAYRDHGWPMPRLETHLDEAQATLDVLRDLGIAFEDVAEQLEREGVRRFTEPFDKLLAALEQRRLQFALTH